MTNTTIPLAELRAQFRAELDGTYFNGFTIRRDQLEALIAAAEERDTLREIEKQAQTIDSMPDDWEKQRTLLVNWLRGSVTVSEDMQQRIAAKYLKCRVEDVPAQRDLAEKAERYEKSLKDAYRVADRAGFTEVADIIEKALAGGKEGVS